MKKPTNRCHLQLIETMVKTLYKDDQKPFDAGSDKGPMIPAISQTDSLAFRIFITDETGMASASTTYKRQATRRLSLWCFNPGITFRDLAKAKVRSFILASGTLSPMTSFAHELQLPFKFQLENLHVISPAQILVQVLKTGPNDVLLNSSFSQRNNAVYQSELGLSIWKVSKLIPDGLLVFFPSYSVMDGCIELWKVTSLLPHNLLLYLLVR